MNLSDSNPSACAQKRHLLCLTLDTDPDGLNAQVPDRRSLEWEGLENVQSLPGKLEDISGNRVPMTWFVRADGQLETMLGSAAYLLETYDDFWTRMKKAGDEVAWHPHLYRQKNPEDAPQIITDPHHAREELQRLWSELQGKLQPTVFRNGEGWHSEETYATVEQLGFRCDSTAIPGRKGGVGHPMNWEGAPNQPYFPAAQNLRQSGRLRAMAELPMNTWLVQGPHDERPRLRYMNPAVHPRLFGSALQRWETACNAPSADLCVWVMIFHPDEVLFARGADALYCRSLDGLCTNVRAISQSLQRLGHTFEWVTVSTAAERWRASQAQIA
jgi:hypothetical protein